MHLGDEHVFIYTFRPIPLSIVIWIIRSQPFPATFQVYEAEVKELKVRTSVHQCSPPQKVVEDSGEVVTLK